MYTITKWPNQLRKKKEEEEILKGKLGIARRVETGRRRLDNGIIVFFVFVDAVARVQDDVFTVR